MAYDAQTTANLHPGMTLQISQQGFVLRPDIRANATSLRSSSMSSSFAAGSSERTIGCGPDASNASSSFTMLSARNCSGVFGSVFMLVLNLYLFNVFSALRHSLKNARVLASKPALSPLTYRYL